jgi:hypothetical protein
VSGDKGHLCRTAACANTRGCEPDGCLREGRGDLRIGQRMRSKGKETGS